MNKKWFKIMFWGAGIFLLIIFLGIALIRFNTYHPSFEALNNSKDATVENKTIIFKGNPEKPAILFYQGALVENTSYSIWAKKLYDIGYSVYLIKAPLNLAILSPNKADELIETNNIKNYAIGGHSLGGVIASQFAAKNKTDSRLKGVFFLASYPNDKGNLNNFLGDVLSVTGSSDGVINNNKYNEAKQYLPNQTQYKTIEGGNHSGFGSYGEQKKDNKSLISNKMQQEQIADILINWVSEIEY